MGKQEMMEITDLQSITIRPARNGWILEVMELRGSTTLIFGSWADLLAALNAATVARS